MSPVRFIKLFVDKHGNLLSLIIILFSASVLRLFRLWDVPFMHDEFSALFRTSHNSLSSLLDQGVMRNDSHPAGVQVFLFYWVKLFGFNEFWVKIPFAIIGVLSVVLVYATGKRLFGISTGLYAAAALSGLQYFVFYSQLARPYAVGLFFVLLAANLLSVMAKRGNEAKTNVFLLYGVSLSLAAYSQHFAALTAGLVYVLGWFLLQRTLWKKYLAAGLLSLLLYIPHLNITYFQLSAGGIGGWLGKPAPAFLFEYFSYLSHYSLWMAFVLLLPLLMCRCSGISAKLKASGILMLIFILTYAIGHSYSVFRTPILQFSTLYFAAPFALLALYSAIPPQKAFVNLIATIAIVGVGGYTLIAHRQHYDLMYRQGYDQTALLMKKHAESYPDRSFFAAVGGQTAMFGFYLGSQRESNLIHLYNFRDNQADFWRLLDTTSAQRIGFAWSDYAPYEWTEAVRSRFQLLKEYHSWFNTEYYLIEKVENGQRSFRENELVLLDEKFADPFPSFSVADEFGLLWEKDAAELLRLDDVLIAGSLGGVAVDTLQGVKFVLEFREKGSGKVVHWGGGHLHTDTILPGERFFLHLAHRFDEGPMHLQNCQIRVYVWNQQHEKFFVTQRLLYVASRNPRLLGLFKAIKE